MDTGIKDVYDRIRRVDERIEPPSELVDTVTKSAVDLTTHKIASVIRFKSDDVVSDIGLDRNNIDRNDLMSFFDNESEKYDVEDAREHTAESWKLSDHVWVTTEDFGSYQNELEKLGTETNQDIEDALKVNTKFHESMQFGEFVYPQDGVEEPIINLFSGMIAQDETAGTWLQRVLTFDFKNDLFHLVYGDGFYDLATIKTDWQRIKSGLRSTVAHELVHYVDYRLGSLFGDPGLEGLTTKEEVEKISSITHDLRAGEFWPNLEGFLNRIESEVSQHGKIPRPVWKVWTYSIAPASVEKTANELAPDRMGSLIYSDLRPLKPFDELKSEAPEAWRKAVKVATKVAQNEGWLEESEKDLPENYQTVIESIRS